MFPLAAPFPMMRPISRTLIVCTSPICFSPLLRNTTPTASTHSAKIRMMSILVMLQIPVTNEPDAELVHALSDARADQRVKFVPKFIERRMRVKLGIAGRQQREQFQNVGFVHVRVLQQAKNPVRVAEVVATKTGLREPRETEIDRRVRGPVQA